jgi:hypothetical protein
MTYIENPHSAQEPRTPLHHRTIEYWVKPHHVARALGAVERDAGMFILHRGGSSIVTRRGEAIWTDDIGVTGKGSISLICNLLHCSEEVAAEWLRNFALLRWPFLRPDYFDAKAVE